MIVRKAANYRGTLRFPSQEHDPLHVTLVGCAQVRGRPGDRNFSVRIGRSSVFVELRKKRARAIPEANSMRIPEQPPPGSGAHQPALVIRNVCPAVSRAKVSERRLPRAGGAAKEYTSTLTRDTGGVNRRQIELRQGIIRDRFEEIVADKGAISRRLRIQPAERGIAGMVANGVVLCIRR